MDPKLEPDTTQHYLFRWIDKEAGLKTKPLEKSYPILSKSIWRENAGADNQAKMLSCAGCKLNRHHQIWQSLAVGIHSTEENSSGWQCQRQDCKYSLKHPIIKSCKINVRTGSGAFSVDLMNLVAYFADNADLDDMDSDVASHLSRVFVRFFLSWRGAWRTPITSGRPQFVLLLWCTGAWTLLSAFRGTIRRFNHFQKTGGFTLPSGSIRFQEPSQFWRMSLEK